MLSSNDDLQERRYLNVKKRKGVLLKYKAIATWIRYML
jgi:hypothetical protein